MENKSPRERYMKSVIPKIEALINNTPSRVLTSKHYTPREVQFDETKANEVLKWERKVFDERRRKYGDKPFSFRVNQIVRLQNKYQDNPMIRKSYKGSFSEELWIIDERYETTPHTYKVRSFANEELNERVYSPELIRVTN